jgi:hypothetical protein
MQKVNLRDLSLLKISVLSPGNGAMLISVKLLMSATPLLAVVGGPSLTGLSKRPFDPCH